MSVKKYNNSPQFDGFSKVTIIVTDKVSYTAGNNLGRELRVENPWGNQRMAEEMLAQLSGFQYQPYNAEGAMLNPAAELGDGVTVAGDYSGLYYISTTLDSLCAADIRAPHDEEINHEYPYTEITDRATQRSLVRVNNYIDETNEALQQETEKIYSELAIQADEISARVTKEGGDNKSFGWTLTEDGFVLSSGSREVFRADEHGITVTGQIRATSGYIGNEARGFLINSSSLANGMTGLNDTENNGVYLGTDGIALGKGNFKVTSGGVITAKSGTIGGFELGSSFIRGGDLTLYSNGGISGKDWSISANGYANFKNFNGVGSLSGSFSGGGASFGGGGSWLPTSTRIGGTDMPTYIKNIVADTVTANWFSGKTVVANGVNANYVYCAALTVDGAQAKWATKRFYDSLGEFIGSITYLAPSWE